MKLTKEEFLKIKDYILFLINNKNPCQNCSIRQDICTGCTTQKNYIEKLKEVDLPQELKIDSILFYVKSCCKYWELQNEINRLKVKYNNLEEQIVMKEKSLGISDLIEELNKIKEDGLSEEL